VLPGSGGSSRPCVEMSSTTAWQQLEMLPPGQLLWGTQSIPSPRSTPAVTRTSIQANTLLAVTSTAHQYTPQAPLPRADLVKRGHMAHFVAPPAAKVFLGHRAHAAEDPLLALYDPGAQGYASVWPE
jgi:hypothetical protein